MIAVMAVALQVHSEEAAVSWPSDGWKARARVEALREWPTV